MAQNIDSRSPELAYQTKPNIIIPKTDARTPTVIRDLAAQQDELHRIARSGLTVSRATNVLTDTYNVVSKEA